MKKGRRLQSPVLPFTKPSTGSDVVIDVHLLLSDLALSLALELFRLALDLLARVPGYTPNSIANAPLGLIKKPFAQVLEPVPGEVVRHVNLLMQEPPSPPPQKRHHCGSRLSPRASDMPHTAAESAKAVASIYHVIYRF